MFRDFGQINQNHTPVGGYQQHPNFYSEQGYIPTPQRGLSARQLRRAGIVLPELATDMGMDEFEQEFAPERPYEELLGNLELPIATYREQIKEAVRNNQVTIVVGETGSGKSTQMPQILLEDGYDTISLTQPRRLAAYMVAERVQQELDETLGKTRSHELVGYQTAEKTTVTSNTKIPVITDGIEVIKQLYDEDDTAKTVHILDEVHEWNTNIEFTVGLIRKRLTENTGAKFVLTSATMDAHRLAGFFADATGTLPPVIEVPGRTFPIEKTEKPESTVLAEILASATERPDEDILVFVPGKQEISDVIDGLIKRLPDHIKNTATILPLHAKLRKEEQDKINMPTKGLKIVIATNVAQTSLTIDGIDVVIDAGLERRIELDGEGIEGLQKFPVSQADCDQRAGRTGRVAAGRYVLTRYDDKTEFVPYMSRVKYPQAEILRTNLDRTVLRAAAVGIDMTEMVLFHPVDQDTVKKSQEALYNLGALDENGIITPLGARMNKFPVRPGSARMLMEVLPMAPLVQAQMAAIVASIEVGGLPYFAHDSGFAWKDLVTTATSDLLAQLEIFTKCQNMSDKELAEYDLDVQNVRRAQELYGKIIRYTGVWDGDLIVPTADEQENIKRAIYAGTINSVYQYAGDGNYERMTGASIHTPREISRRSVVNGAPTYVVGSPYRVEMRHGGSTIDKHIIESVTVLSDPKILGKVAASHLLSWEPIGKVWRNGKLREVEEVVFNRSLRLGEQREVEAAQNTENQDYAIQSLLDNAGPAQLKLRELKKQLEDLQQLTTLKIPLLSQDMLVSLLREAAQEAGLNQSRIDNKLRQIMVARKISLDEIISSEERSKIHAASPREISNGTSKWKLDYHQGIPVVSRFSYEQIAEINNELYLSDGRQVLFWHGRRRMTLSEVIEDMTILI